MDKRGHIPVSGMQVIEEILHAHEVTPTRQRLAIASYMLREQQHLSAEDILDQVNVEGTKVSKATVYNTLRLFVKQGLLREVVLDPNRTLFDSNTTEHHHVLNTETGEIRDIQHIDIDPISVSGLAAGEKIEGIDVVLRVTTPG